jgi:hypothetical protein
MVEALVDASMTSFVLCRVKCTRWAQWVLLNICASACMSGRAQIAGYKSDTRRGAPQRRLDDDEASIAEDDNSDGGDVSLAGSDGGGGGVNRGRAAAIHPSGGYSGGGDGRGGGAGGGYGLDAEGSPNVRAARAQIVWAQGTSFI